MENKNIEEKEVTETEEVSEQPKKESKGKKALANIGKAGKGFVSDFKAFMNKGNIVNMAVAFVMGAAFTAIITSLVDNIFTPLISLIFGKANFTELFLMIGTTQFNYGNVILAIIKFIIIAFVLFLIVRALASASSGIKKLKKGQKPEPAPEPTPAPETDVQILADIRSLLQKVDITEKKADGK
jgi:large conductance mechanosensitive channel